MLRKPRGVVTLGHAAVQHIWIFMSNSGLSYLLPMYVVVRFPWTSPMSQLHLALVFENARLGLCSVRRGSKYTSCCWNRSRLLECGPNLKFKSNWSPGCLGWSKTGCWCSSRFCKCTGNYWISCLCCWCSSRLLMCCLNVYTGWPPVGLGWNWTGCCCPYGWISVMVIVVILLVVFIAPFVSACDTISVLVDAWCLWQFAGFVVLLWAGLCFKLSNACHSASPPPLACSHGSQ